MMRQNFLAYKESSFSTMDFLNFSKEVLFLILTLTAEARRSIMYSSLDLVFAGGCSVMISNTIEKFDLNYKL